MKRKFVGGKRVNKCERTVDRMAGTIFAFDDIKDKKDDEIVEVCF